MAAPVHVGEPDSQRQSVRVIAAKFGEPSGAPAVRHAPGRSDGGRSHEPSRSATRATLVRTPTTRVTISAAASTGAVLVLRGEPDRAYSNEAPFAHSRIGAHVLPDLVEAAVRAGEREVAVSALTQLARRASACHSELELGLLARSRALLADDDDAERLYGEAIKHLERCRSARELARTHLGYGEWLRRRRRRCDARRELRTAHELFNAIGDEAFARHARVELLATGEHARKRSTGPNDELTPQEAQAARLAGEGASNAEIAAQMFLSPHTVSFHLRKVYRKLGITNRTQLVRIVYLAHEAGAGGLLVG